MRQLMLWDAGDAELLAETARCSRLPHRYDRCIILPYPKFLVRDVIYTSRAYALMPVRLSVTKCIGAL